MNSIISPLSSLKRSLKSINIGQKRVGTIFLAFITVLCPLIITIIFVKTLFHSDLSNFQLIWNDEIQYWLEINAFKYVGLNSGYFSVEELISSASFSHFGTHGPVYPIFMGTLAKFFGWNLNTGMIFNFIFIATGLALYIVLVRADSQKIIFLLLFMIVSFPLLAYIPTTMQESINQALAMVICGIFINLMSNKSTKIVIIGFVILIFASIIRVTWSFMFFPLLWITSKSDKPKQKLVPLFSSFGLTTLFFLLYIYWTSTFPGWFSYRLFQIKPFTIKNFLMTIFINMRDNAWKFIHPSDTSNPVEIFQRYLIIFLLIFIGVLIYRRKFQFIVPFFALTVEVALTIIAYDVRSFLDYRLLAPFLIFSVLFLIFYSRSFEVRLPLGLLLAASIAFYPVFVRSYQVDLHAHRFKKDVHSIPENNATGLLGKITYSESSLPWCNSLFTTDRFSPDLLSLQPGIGVNMVLDVDRVSLPVKSHYIYIEPAFIKTLKLDGSISLVGSSGERSLYVRTDDDCQ